MTHTTQACILFDLDGTLVDTAPDFIRIIKALCQQYAHPTPSDDAIRAEVSSGARAMVALMLGQTCFDDHNPILLAYRDVFLQTYAKDICVDSRLFDGLDNFLSSLEKQGIAWGIITNKPRHLAKALLDKLNLSQRCAVLVCPEDVKQTKPDPEPMFLACNTLNIQPKNCLYIGDHPRDIIAGKQAGMTTMIAGFGYLPPDSGTLDTWGADSIAMTSDELICQCHAWLNTQLHTKNE